MMVATRLPGPSRLAMPTAAKTLAPGTGTGKHAFHARQLFHHVERIAVGNSNDFVSQRAVKRLGNEACADAFDLVIALRTAAEHRAFGLHSDGKRLSDSAL